jgi:hypothetical protein
MNEEPKLLLEHIRGTREEGRHILMHAVPTVGLMLAAGVGMFVYKDHHLLAWFWQRDPWFPWIWMVMVCGIGGFLIFGVGVRTFRMDKQFVLRVFEDRIECESPHHSSGPSFRVAFADLQSLDKDTREDTRWAIVTGAGEAFELTINYDNPVDRIVACIRAARPDLEILEITRKNFRAIWTARLKGMAPKSEAAQMVGDGK